jgi:Bacterial membrane protein YfhO
MRAAERSSRKLKPFILPIALVALGLGFALIPLAQGRMFFYWDNAQQHYAQTVFLEDGLRHGTIPQWWPNVGLGFPATAEGQAAHYHPIRLLCALLFSAPAALMWELAIYFVIAGLSTFYFLRELRLHRFACFLGAASQMFTGFAIVYVRNIALHRSFCLLPLAMLCAERWVKRRSVASLASAAMVIGLQFLAGHPSLAIVTAVGTTVYLTLRLTQQAFGGREKRPAHLITLVRPLAAWILAIGLGMGVAAIQVIPTFLHVQQSQRQGGLSYESAVEVLPATPRGLGQLVFPYAYEQGDFLSKPAPWGSFNPVPTAGMYSGLFCVVFAPIALWWWRRRRPDATLALSASLVTALAFALGPRAPLFPLLWSLPGMNGLRFPSRFLLWAAFCLSCLAAIGGQRLMAAGRSRLRPQSGIAPLGLVGFGLVVGAAAIAWGLPDARLGVGLSLAEYAVGLLIAFVLLRTRGIVQRRVLLVAAGLAIGDLLMFRAIGGYAPSVPIAEAINPPAAVAALQRDPDRFRILSLIESENGAFFTQDLRDYAQADLCTIWGLDSTDVFLSLFLKRYYAVRLSVVHELLQRPASAGSLASFLGALNVKYVVAPRELNLPGWEQTSEGARTAVFRIPSFSPRAFLVGQVVEQHFELRDEWRQLSDSRLASYRRDVLDWQSRSVDAQILDHVMDRQLDYGSTAEVLGANSINVQGIDATASVEELRTAPDEMRFSVHSSKPAFLVISSSFYPGWVATVNGEPTRVFQTNWVMSGVAVPAGDSDVVLHYTTPGFKAGVVISLAALVVIGAVLLRPAFLHRVLR